MMHAIVKFGHATTLKQVKSFGCLDIVLVLKQNVFSLHMNGLFSSHI